MEHLFVYLCTSPISHWKVYVYGRLATACRSCLPVAKGTFGIFFEFVIITIDHAWQLLKQGLGLGLVLNCK